MVDRGIWSKPEKGWFISKIRKSAPDADAAMTSSEAGGEAASATSDDIGAVRADCAPCRIRFTNDTGSSDTGFVPFRCGPRGRALTDATTAAARGGISGTLRRAPIDGEAPRFIPGSVRDRGEGGPRKRVSTGRTPSDTTSLDSRP